MIKQKQLKTNKALQKALIGILYMEITPDNRSIMKNADSDLARVIKEEGFISDKSELLRIWVRGSKNNDSRDTVSIDVQEEFSSNYRTSYHTFYIEDGEFI